MDTKTSLKPELGHEKKGTGKADALSLFDVDASVAARLTLYRRGSPERDYDDSLPDDTGSTNDGRDPLLPAVCLSSVSPINDDVENNKNPPDSEERFKGLYCSSCQTLFEDRKSQVEHYKLDWHRYNLKRSLVCLAPVTQNEFEEAVTQREIEGGELSSISGSDDEDDDGYDDGGDRDDNDDVDFKNTEKKISDTQRLPNFQVEDSRPNSHPVPPRHHHHHPKLFFRLPDGKIASIYRSLLYPKLDKREGAPPEEDAIEGSVDRLRRAIQDIGKAQTALILTGGGHFAAAVFCGNGVVQHKTFHRYVVRQKQGGTQSGKDSCGRAPKSAGASLRRYNEAALSKDIKELLGETWAPLIATCSRIFVRAPSSNRHIFFSGKTPLFPKSDDRVRLIPFLTRRPTFNEVQRVFRVLTSFEIYDLGGDCDVVFGKSGFPKSPPKKLVVTKEASAKPEATNKSVAEEAGKGGIDGSGLRFRRTRPQEAPDVERSSPDDDTDDDGDDDGVGESLAALSFQLESLDTSGLKEFDCDLGEPSAAGRRRNKRKPAGKTGSGARNCRREIEEDARDGVVDDDPTIRRVHAMYKNDLLTFCRTVDEEGFAKILKKCASEFRDDCSNMAGTDRDDDEDEEVGQRIRTNLIPRLLNTPIRIGISSQFTYLLHVAAQTGSGGAGCDGGRGEQKRFVEYLLTVGCDPSKKNGEGKTVYSSTDKAIRLVLRDFRARFPDKFDYEAAGIPAPVSAKEAAEKAERQAERKKKLRRAKKERDKEKREEWVEEEKRRKEEKESEEARRRFLALSDRERRALAAEKRFAAQTNRCWLCAGDMNGLVPFEYLDFKFCAVKCLQEHRRKTTTSSST